VLTGGYVPGSFTDGPLLRAMRAGALLYLEEFNRVPEETLNVLITVLTEGEIAVPRLDAVRAETGRRRVPPSRRDRVRGVAPPDPPDQQGLPARAGTARRDRVRGPARRTLGRAELAARHPSLAAVSPAAGQLDPGGFAGLLAADPDAAVLLLADLARATDRELRAAAGRLAARVFFQLARAGREPARGTRRLVPGRAEGDLDLDRTLDRLSGPWPPGASELVTSAWQAQRRSVCLLVDASGSMSGLAVAIAAVAAASLVLAADGTLTPGIAAFSGAVSVLQTAGRRRPPAELLGDLLALRGHGMTDLAAALRAAVLSQPGVPGQRFPGDVRGGVPERGQGGPQPGLTASALWMPFAAWLSATAPDQGGTHGAAEVPEGRCPAARAWHVFWWP